MKYNKKEVDTMTYVDALNVAIANLSDAEAVETLSALRDQYVKRASAERKPTAKQTENAGIKTQILNELEADVLYTAGDIAKLFEGLTVQRVSALLSQLVADGSLVKTVEKRKSFYSLA